MVDENRLGRDYELHEEIGRTAWAILRRATADSDGTQVTAKILRPEFAEDREMRGRLLAEEAALRGLRHESIVELRDLVAERGLLALVLEYVDGEPLAAGRSVAEVRVIGAQVAAALAAAHAAGEAHLGLTPAEIRVVRGSEPPRVKVTGFGAAPTETTPYSAPEARAEGALNSAADIFSLGRILVGLAPDLGPELIDTTAADPAVRPSAADLATRLGDPAPVSRPVEETSAEVAAAEPVPVELPEQTPLQVERASVPSTVEAGPELIGAPAIPSAASTRRRQAVVAGAAAAVFAVVIGFSVHAKANSSTAGPQPTVPIDTTPTAPAPRLSATVLVAQTQRSTMAAHLPGGAGTLYLALRDGKALAYFCDGKKVEAWYRGTAADGELKLSGRNGNTMTGDFSKTAASGTVTFKGDPTGYSVPEVKKPSGLYRASTKVRNAKIDGTWIVLPNGEQVGVLVTDGVSGPAPDLDLGAGGTTTIDGTTVTATEVDVETGAGLD